MPNGESKLTSSGAGIMKRTGRSTTGRGASACRTITPTVTIAIAAMASQATSSRRPTEAGLGAANEVVAPDLVRSEK